MQPIIPTITRGETGAPVANLQDALVQVLERRLIRALPLPNRPNVRELQSLNEGLKEDRARSLFGEATAQVVVYYQVQEGLGDHLRGVVEDGTAAKLNEVMRSIGRLDDPDAEGFIVSGQVQGARAGHRVLAYDQDFRGDGELLGESSIDGLGRYEIRYSAEQFKLADKGRADLRVVVCERDGRELVSSGIIFNADPNVVVDLAVDPDPTAPSEYERYLADLAVVLQGLTLRDVASGKPEQLERDLNFLAGDTGIERQHISWLVQAARLERETHGIPPEVFYGIFRQGLPTQLRDLFPIDPGALSAALERSIKENVIPARLRDGIRGYLETLQQFRLTREQEPSRDPAYPTLKDRLGDLFTDDQLFELAVADAKHPIFSDEWKHAVTGAGFDAKQIATIQTTYLLGGLTQNNHTLAQTLRQRFELSAPSDLRKLTSLDRTEWDAMASEHGVAAEQRELYVKNIVTALDASFAGAVMARELERDRLAVPEDARPLLKRFFRNNPTFEFDIHYVSPFLAEGADLTDIELEQLPRLKKEVLRLDRVRKLVPKSTDFDLISSANALLAKNFDSGHRIVSVGRRDFVAGIRDTLPGGEAAADRLYDQATHNSMLAQVLASEHVSNAATPIAVLANPGQPVAATNAIQIPDLATLFGSQEFCNCSHCRAVYSPAAYFVDLLKFIWNRQTANPNLKDRLFSRRPDLGEIELTCENTNTPLPYVDLVTEILEEAVAPLPAFAATFLPVGSIAELDGCNLPQLKLINSAPPLNAATPLASLSSSARIQVVKRGVLWTIDEPAFSYTIRAENGAVKLIARGRQTNGSAAERGAQPQYINDRAYDTLRTQVFPWSLPFDFSLETSAAYLKHFELRPAQILEAFRPGERSAIFNSLAHACSQLDLGIDEAKIVTGETIGQAGAPAVGGWNFWGFAQSNGGIPNPTSNSGTLGGAGGSVWFQVVGGRIDALLQQSNLTYRELLDLLDTYFINPVVTGTRQLTVVSTDPSSAETCETDKLKLEGFNEDVAIRFMRFVRLWRRLGWSARDLDRAITAFAPPLGSKAASTNDIKANSAFLVKLAHIRRLNQELNVPVARLLSWWSNIDTNQYREYTDAAPLSIASVYAEVFRSRIVPNSASAAFPEDHTKLNGKLSDHYGSIASALGLSSQDLARLATHVKVLPKANALAGLDDALNLENLSQLHRHSVLAKSLRLPVRDYLILLDLTESKAQPFLSTVDSIMFVERVRHLQEAEFSAVQLEELLRAPAPGSASAKGMEERALAVLEDLRRNLRPLAAEYGALDPADDAQGDLLRRKLVLLNWNSSLVDNVVATLSGAMTYDAPLNALPLALVLPNADGPIRVDLVLAAGGTVSIPTGLRDTVTHRCLDKQFAVRDDDT